MQNTTQTTVTRGKQLSTFARISAISLAGYWFSSYALQSLKNTALTAFLIIAIWKCDRIAHTCGTFFMSQDRSGSRSDSDSFAQLIVNNEDTLNTSVAVQDGSYTRL